MIIKGYITFFAAGMFMVSCTTGLYEEEPGSDPVAMFEHFWETFNTDYGPFVQRNVDWQQVYDQYRPLIEVSSTEDQLYGIFKQMLLPLDDTHVKLLRPGEQLYTPNRYYRLRIEDALFDTALIRLRLK